ncbi:hypothetical protein BHE90_012720 [Fusarium euwallaceae]|uniref:Uncharacterized protein n=3 Tax=Fusarium solani species complex TaxID=232080 RepID=A0A3M2RUM9_9HYPO|nr:hypothetical protein CDV36_011778 [Fusarium kuroshium]RSL77667.1 hypothetical protein CEP51_008859 [Fusarium floridanum]RTE72857.1 hypothetical protein BHE90_012720 [Fusarium euwallaceae]
MTEGTLGIWELGFFLSSKFQVLPPPDEPPSFILETILRQDNLRFHVDQNTFSSPFSRLVPFRYILNFPYSVKAASCT